LKYWPLIWSALARKPAEGLLTFFGVATAFTLLALMISMNLTTRQLLNHVPLNHLMVFGRFPDAVGRQGMPLAMGEQLSRMEGVRAVGPYRFLGGYHVDQHQSLGVRLVDPGMRAIWPTEPLTASQWDQLFSTPTGLFMSVKAAAKWGIKRGDTFTVTAPQMARTDGGTTWEFQVLGIVPDDTNLSGNSGFLIGNARYVENTVPLDQRSVDYYYYVAVKDPAQAMAVGRRIDAFYANSSRSTITVQQRYDTMAITNRGFNTLTMTLAIGSAGFAMVLFLTANAIARSVRERVPEFAVLKTVGYLGHHLMSLVFIETALPCVLGAALGTAAAAVVGHWSSHLLDATLARMVSTALPVLPVLGVAVALALVLALASCAVPLLRLRQLSVTDALAGR
jgi:putative ABC transport system permease protein